MKVAVFIDELDRCPSEQVVNILEAIKLFLAENIFIVLLAVDTRVVAEAITLHYKDMNNPDLAREYMEKIIQVPIQVPHPSKPQIEEFLENLMPIENQEEDDDDETKNKAKKKKLSSAPNSIATKNPGTLIRPYFRMNDLKSCS